MSLPKQDSDAHRRAVDLTRELWLSRSHPTNFDLTEAVSMAIEEVGATELAAALVDSLLLVIDEAVEESGRETEEYLLEVELRRTDRH
ncbi:MULTISPECIES: hypothetical protein [Streptomyces]|uniref:hypothetical protein n=1 Tax=Streptomyces TaxID=1883 RepID=UPI0011611AAD|nr:MULTISPECIES: hypothetical protein [Streptomyces]